MSATELGSDRARILVGDAKDRLADLDEDSVHTVVTSPPYWGLRDYDVDGQIGLEDSIEEHIRVLVDVFREVRRVLRPDGTLWLNYGDRSAGDNGDPTTGDVTGSNQQPDEAPSPDELHPRSRVGMPWRVALRLMADGWILRDEIIWHKKNPMPESVTNRPTRAHDQLFLFAPDYPYFYDDVAIREPASENTNSRGQNNPPKVADEDTNVRNKQSFHENTAEILATRNKRTVWPLTSKPYPEAHFATFPPSLPRPCIQAGTSEAGCCPECGAPLKRETERVPTGWDGSEYGERAVEATGGALEGGTEASTLGSPSGTGTADYETLGWQPTCEHDVTPETAEPCTVLDPFLGAGTTSLVALEEGRNAVGVELNPDYAEMAWERIRDLAEMPRLDQVGGHA